ncbi:hypothetical protein N7472_003221 [Penicillium cf. griseofulvum]|uniref:Uncharacterized protein n=1 Tax=Penicillium cf. griseofulvum TaxID=2972120 RepID=A0A9W9MSR3_9EURO|nr:hypothetical protein N7472_003221 [Penicillium cf. griseofulvum]
MFSRHLDRDTQRDIVVHSMASDAGDSCADAGDDCVHYGDVVASRIAAAALSNPRTNQGRPESSVRNS